MSETSSGGGCGGELAPCGCMECAPLRVAERAAAKPTIPLRIRVGVTADGRWIAMGSTFPTAVSGSPGEVEEALTEIAADEDAGPIVAWHWITAEIPMPETEQSEMKGEVEHG